VSGSHLPVEERQGARAKVRSSHLPVEERQGARAKVRSSHLPVEERQGRRGEGERLPSPPSSPAARERKGG